MHRKLILMRHGKAEDPREGDDHGRRLVPTGVAQAKATAAALRAAGHVPEAAMVSDAARAQETFHAAGFALDEGRVLFDRLLYGGATHGLGRLASRVPDDVGTLLVIGHNPELESIVRGLTGVLVALGTGDAALLERQSSKWHDSLTAGWRFVDVYRG